MLGAKDFLCECLDFLERFFNNVLFEAFCLEVVRRLRPAETVEASQQVAEAATGAKPRRRASEWNLRSTAPGPKPNDKHDLCGIFFLKRVPALTGGGEDDEDAPAAVEGPETAEVSP